MSISATEKRLIEFIAQDKHDPLRFVQTAYPWGKGELKDSTGPRKWQLETLSLIGKHLQNPETRFIPLRIAVSSGHSIGKSALISMIVHWGLSTFPNTKIVVTANSEPQLRTKTWAELSKWFRMAINSHWFKVTATSVASVDKNAERTWRADALPWTEHNPEAFAGLHNVGRRLIVIFDESSNISEKIWEVVQGAMTGENTEILWIAFGNPTRNSGAFRECFGRFKHRWKTRQIDSRTVEGVNKEEIQELIEDYGEDSDRVRIRVKGEFPRAGTSQFIPSDIVEAARKREAEANLYDPLIMGVDVSRFGDDCFDDITEILTDKGWKLFSDLKGTEKVLSMKKDKSSWEKIDKIHEYDFDGELNLFEKNHVNFCITDNHRMLVRANPKSKNYVFRAYKDLPQDFVIRQENGWSGKNLSSIKFKSKVKMPHGGYRNREWVFSFEDWATFLGWFVSEGHVYYDKRRGAKRIVVTQNPGIKQEQIKALLTKMGLKWRMTPNGCQMEFTNNPIGNYLTKQCGTGATNKKVPKNIKDGSEKIINCFLDSFLLGDGTGRKDGTGRTYITSSKILADDLQEMLAKLGRAGKLRMKEKKGSVFYIGDRAVIRKNDTYVLYERNSKFGKTVNKRYVKKVQYNGKIWCVSTKYQSIYVRRKGVSMWSGNSTVICLRRGRDAKSIPWIKLSGADTMQVAAKVMELHNRYRPDAVFVDGGGVGGGVIDRLRMMKYPNIIEVQFGSKADGSITTADKDVAYANKRAEMWGVMREWLKGGMIPDDPDLASQLTGVEYEYIMRDGRDAILLEKKSEMKARGLMSPDEADALCLTFSFPVMPSDHSSSFKSNHQSTHLSHYDPLSLNYLRQKPKK